MSEEEILEIAHRKAWRYKHEAEAYGGDVYQFNNGCMVNFARAIETKIREENAMICESTIANAEDWDSTYWDQAVELCARRIRARAALAKLEESHD